MPDSTESCSCPVEGGILGVSHCAAAAGPGDADPPWGGKLLRPSRTKERGEGEEKKEAKKEASVVLFLATDNYISAALLNGSQISPSIPRVSCLKIVTGCLQARIKRTLV